MIKAIIFDVGGVLIDETYKWMSNDALATFGLTEELFVAALVQYEHDLLTGKMTEQVFWQHVAADTGIALPDPLIIMGDEWQKTFRTHDDVIELVKRLQDNGYVTAILSNTIPPHTSHNRTVGLYDPFPTVILSDEVGLRKPDIAFFQHALGVLGVKAEEAAFIDDMEKNTTAAQSLGMHAILYQNSEQLREELLLLKIFL